MPSAAHATRLIRGLECEIWVAFVAGTTRPRQSTARVFGRSKRRNGGVREYESLRGAVDSCKRMLENPTPMIAARLIVITSPDEAAAHELRRESQAPLRRRSAGDGLWRAAHGSNSAVHRSPPRHGLHGDGFDQRNSPGSDDEPCDDLQLRCGVSRSAGGPTLRVRWDASKSNCDLQIGDAVVVEYKLGTIPRRTKSSWATFSGSERPCWAPASCFCSSVATPDPLLRQRKALGVSTQGCGCSRRDVTEAHHAFRVPHHPNSRCDDPCPERGTAFRVASSTLRRAIRE